MTGVSGLAGLSPADASAVTSALARIDANLALREAEAGATAISAAFSLCREYAIDAEAWAKGSGEVAFWSGDVGLGAPGRLRL